MKTKKPIVIQQGAEAVIILVEEKEDGAVKKEGDASGNLGAIRVIKDRIKKSYRIEQIDIKLRKQRTKAEIKLLEKASKIINAPKPIETKKDKEAEEFGLIRIPYIEGKKLSEYLDKLPTKLAKETCKKIGQSISKLHENNIIHGDLTTSNIILDKNNQVWFIDFGLGFHSERAEDKAVDLHLIRQALEAKHFQHFKEYWKAIESGYRSKTQNKNNSNSSSNSTKILEQLKKVESRGRYKDKY